MRAWCCYGKLVPLSVYTTQGISHKAGIHCNTGLRRKAGIAILDYKPEVIESGLQNATNIIFHACYVTGS
jgi:hypothetical protein